jgi:hypothetical protein
MRSIFYSGGKVHERDSHARIHAFSFLDWALNST